MSLSENRPHFSGTCALELNIELLNLVGLSLGAGDPFFHVRQRHDCLAVGRALRIELHVIGEEARHHRSVHGIRHARLRPEQVRPFAGGEALAPDGDDAIDIGLRPGPDLEAGIMRLEVHRQRRAHVAEAGVHLARDRAAARAIGPIVRHKLSIGLDLVEIFGDRERVPDLHAFVGEAGHQERRRQQQQFGTCRGVVAARLLLLECEASHLAEQPSAQRPGAVVLAGDGERRHQASPMREPVCPKKVSRTATKNALAFSERRASASKRL